MEEFKNENMIDGSIGMDGSIVQNPEDDETAKKEKPKKGLGITYDRHGMRIRKKPGRKKKRGRKRKPKYKRKRGRHKKPGPKKKPKKPGRHKKPGPKKKPGKPGRPPKPKKPRKKPGPKRKPHRKKKSKSVEAKYKIIKPFDNRHKTLLYTTDENGNKVRITKEGTIYKGNNRPAKIGNYYRPALLIDTRIGYGFTHEDYVRECVYAGKKAHKEGSRFYIRWLNQRRAEAIDGFFERISHCHDTRPVIVIGTIEFPDGAKKIKPMWFEGENMTTFPSGVKGYIDNGFKKAVMKCVHGMDDFKALMLKGGIALECFHRDGVNRFLIRPASTIAIGRRERFAAKGIDMLDRKPSKSWFGGIRRKDLDLDKYGRPIDNPIWVEEMIS